ncbi:MAG: hypothetical protein HY652_06905, partial [Acidobacteria bacterium]|nr:hypothetical protein [Acidobacteriota bacterium]
GVGTGKYDLGYWNLSNPNDPNNRPVIALAEGDLTVSGSIQGAGLLVIRGKYEVFSGFTYDGLVLLMGKGEVAKEENPLLRGGMFIVSMEQDGKGTVKFKDEPKFTLMGNSQVLMNSANVRMAVSLIPFRQVGWREITPAIDQ